MSDENDETSIIRPGQNGAGAALQKVGFGTIETQQNQRETQGSVLAERARAEVQARYIMALQRPRNLEQVRVRVLEHCKRPRFAELAEYAKPIGRDKVRGPSIRFVETALQEYGNVQPEATIVYDDDYRRIVRVSMTDLERNVTYYDDATVEKFVERRKPKDGDEILGSRQNSYGEAVYKIRATEDDFANKVAAQVSKKTRNLGLRILPADIVDEAMWTCKKTRENQDARDPAAARRKIVDSFADLRIMPVDLDAYLGHPFDQASPDELDELRATYVLIREGEVRWPELVEAQKVRRGELDEASKPAEAAASKLQAKIADVRTKQQAKAAEAQQHKATEQKAAEQKPEKTEPKQDAKG